MMSNVQFNDVIALVSDNAAYMKKCFVDNLRGLLPNAVHVTCWAHILSLVGEEFRAALQVCDLLVANMKAIFSKAPGRRARYLQHLRQNNVIDVRLPPAPVITRWNTWFEAALYHAAHLDHYVTFVAREIEKSGSTLHLQTLSKLLYGDQLEQLQAELDFLALHCQRLVGTLTSLEGQSYMAVDIYNKMSDLLSWMRSPGFPYATSSCEVAMLKASTKLALYVEANKQPAIALFKAARVFDPRQIPLLSQNFADHDLCIPTMHSAAGEWRTYLDITTAAIIPNDITAFWKALQSRLPLLAALAKAYIALPISSVDVERSFSKYGSVLSPLRFSLTEDHLRAYCALYYNNSM